LFKAANKRKYFKIPWSINKANSAKKLAIVTNMQPSAIKGCTVFRKSKNYIKLEQKIIKKSMHNHL
jgi:hypothetical protein